MTLNAKWLQGLIFSGVLLIGLVMVRRRPTDKFTALAILIIALILMGVFLPTLSGQILEREGKLFWALSIVLIVWLVWFVIRDLPRITASRAAATAAPALATAPATAPAATERLYAPPATESPPAASDSATTLEEPPNKDESGDSADDAQHGGGNDG